MSKTGTMDYEKLEELLHVKGELAVTLMTHDLSHALGSELLELMLEHVKSGEDGEATRTKKTKEVVKSNAKTLEDKLKEAADHLTQTADALIRNEMGIPEDVEEIIVEINIKGR